MRLIDADELVSDLRNRCSNDVFYKQVKECLIDCAPTVDAKPIKRGRWIFHDDGSGTCDQCRTRQLHIWDFDHSQNFCGHCGADMRGE